jgi:predicted dehydrogenase
MQDRFAIRSVYDTVRRQAELEARQVGCEAAASLSELCQRPDVDAILFLESAWYGLWPLEAACHKRKPILCAPSVTDDESHADRLHRLVEGSGSAVVMALLPRVAPATERLRELVALELGPPRLVLCDEAQASHCTAAYARTGTAAQDGCDLLDWCLSWFAEPPRAVTASALENYYSSLFFELGGSRGVHYSLYRGPGLRSFLRLELVAEKGTARVSLPNRIS